MRLAGEVGTTGKGVAGRQGADATSIYPLIAIVGSIDASRPDSYDPPIQDFELLHQAVAALARSLARRGFRLLVYSSEPRFIEAAFVAAFVGERPQGRELIQVRYPAGASSPAFPEQREAIALFQLLPDPSPEWEVSFYRSLAEVDGILLIGGSYSTVVAGQVAIAMRLPSLVTAGWGGGADKVWSSLAASDLPNQEERNAMDEAWPQDASDYDGHADRLVGVLRSQIERRKDERRSQRRAIAEDAVDRAHKKGLLERERQEARLSPWAAVLMAGALFGVPFAVAPREVSLWLLCLLPLLCGGAGALTKSLVRRGEPEAATRSGALGIEIVLGMVAGGIAGLLFVAMQLVNYPIDLAGDSGLEKFASYAPRLVVLNTCIGFIAGLTWDKVFGKLGALDVVTTEALTNALVNSAEEAPPTD